MRLNINSSKYCGICIGTIPRIIFNSALRTPWTVDVIDVDARVWDKHNRMIDNVMVLPDIGYPQVGPPLVRQYDCTRRYLMADKRQQGIRQSVRYNHTRKQLVVAFDHGKEPYINISPTPPSGIFAFTPDFSFINFYQITDPTKDDGVGEQVLRAYVPAEIKPVNNSVIAGNFADKQLQYPPPPPPPPPPPQSVVTLS